MRECDDDPATHPAGHGRAVGPRKRAAVDPTVASASDARSRNSLSCRTPRHPGVGVGSTRPTGRPREYQQQTFVLFEWDFALWDHRENIPAAATDLAAVIDVARNAWAADA